jgi:hypothetical protein
VSDVADKVRKAADYIERAGLYQGMYWDEEAVDFTDTVSVSEGARLAVEKGVRCCALGALHGHGIPTHGDAYEVVQDFFLERHHGAVQSFNDTPGRTEDEVVAELRALADQLEKEQA